MSRFSKWLIWFDSQFPDPWIVEGTIRTRPVEQLGLILGVIIGFIICYLIF